LNIEREIFSLSDANEINNFRTFQYRQIDRLLDLLEKDLQIIFNHFLPGQSGNKRMPEGEDFGGKVISPLSILVDESQFREGITEACGRSRIRPQGMGDFRKGERVVSLGKGLKHR